jgi:hypothetical protein
MSADNTKRLEASRKVLTGGNHLANFLLGQREFPGRHDDPNEVLQKFGGDVHDVWFAWRAIMDFRDALGSVEAKP